MPAPPSNSPESLGAGLIGLSAEELAQDTFVAAIEKWRRDGIPNNPPAWLNTTARFLAVDRIRRRDTQRSKYQQVAATVAKGPRNRRRPHR